MHDYFIRIIYISNENKPIIDGDEIYIREKGNLEPSRFNYVKKECIHKYCLNTVNDILSYNKKNKNILVLGVCLGGQIVHLLDKDPTVKITGIDLYDTYFDIVKKYSDVSRLRLIKEDAYKYIIETKDTYDVIIFDIFFKDTFENPKFLVSKKFLKKIHEMLPSNKSKFIINSPTYNTQLNFLLKDIFYDFDLDYKTTPKNYNKLYILNKRF